MSESLTCIHVKFLVPAAILGLSSYFLLGWGLGHLIGGEQFREQMVTFFSTIGMIIGTAAFAGFLMEGLKYAFKNKSKFTRELLPASQQAKYPGIVGIVGGALALVFGLLYLLSGFFALHWFGSNASKVLDYPSWDPRSEMWAVGVSGFACHFTLEWD